MGRFLLIDVVVAAGAFFLWYAWFVRYNRGGRAMFCSGCRRRAWEKAASLICGGRLAVHG